MAHIQRSAALCCLGLAFAWTIAADAALIDRGAGLIYDSDRDITWLADANYGAGSAYDDGFLTTDGRMTWQSAVNWAANLSYFDSGRMVTWDDWRLPSTARPDAGCSIAQPVALGTGCTASELGHMYYTELGAPIPTSPPQDYTPLPDPGPFSNLQADGYWSGTAYDASYSYVLNFGFGGAQAADQVTLGYFAWAVRDGDVGVIPAPPAAWLIGAALLSLVPRLRRRRATRA